MCPGGEFHHSRRPEPGTGDRFVQATIGGITEEYDQRVRTSSGGAIMYRYAQTYPVLPGKSDADAKAISSYFYAHPDEYRQSRKAAGVTLERAYLQKTPMGSFVIGYTESEHDLATTLAALGDMSNPLPEVRRLGQRGARRRPDRPAPRTSAGNHRRVAR